MFIPLHLIQFKYSKNTLLRSPPTDCNTPGFFCAGLGCMNKANCTHVRPGPVEGYALRGGLSKGS